MNRISAAVCCAVAMTVSAFPVAAQQVMSAQSGTIHYTEGRVAVDDERVQSRKYGPFTNLKEGQVLSTTDGRAELLLNPGVFLRVAENSSIRMVSARLSDTRVEVKSGDVVLEIADLAKDNAVTMLYKDLTFTAKKKGLYRFDTEANLFRVYTGDAEVTSNGTTHAIKSGYQVTLNDALAQTKFDKKEADEFLAWNQQRDGQISVASVRTSHTLYQNGYSPMGSSWYYDPTFGMFGYVPYRGSFLSPFGYGYYSPVLSYIPYYGYYGGGYGGSAYNSSLYGNRGGVNNSSANNAASYNAGSLPTARAGTSTNSGSMGMSMPSAPASAPSAGGGSFGGGGAHRGR